MSILYHLLHPRYSPMVTQSSRASSIGDNLQRSMEFLKLTCNQKQCVKSGSRNGKWWPSSIFISQLKLLKSGAKTYCSQWMRHSPKHQFRKAFLGDNWLCETHISVQGSLVFLVEGAGETGDSEGRLTEKERAAHWLEVRRAQ